jgi:hypothetical protein
VLNYTKYNMGNIQKRFLFKKLHIHLDRTIASNPVKVKQTTKIRSKQRNRESEGCYKTPKPPQMPRKAVGNIR